MRNEHAADNTAQYIHAMYKMANSLHSIRNKNIKVQPNVSINSAVLSMLNVISTRQGDNSLEIGRQMGISKSAVSQMIAKLEKQELVEKRRKEGNKKEFFPYLTEKGKLCVSDYRFIHDKFYESIDDVVQDFDAGQRKTILDFLARINNTLDNFKMKYAAEGEKNE